MFCYCHHVYYTMITTKNKFIFIPTLLSLHNCYENKTTTQLSWEKNCSIIFLRKFSGSKRISMESSVFFSSGNSVLSEWFVHYTVISPSGTSVESDMLYYPKFPNHFAFIGIGKGPELWSTFVKIFQVSC